MARQTIFENNVQQCEQQENICAGTNEQMPVDETCGFVLARIDQNYFAAAPPQLLHPAAQSWSSHHAAIRDSRVCTEDQEEFCAIDIRDRKQELMTKHQKR